MPRVSKLFLFPSSIANWRTYKRIFSRSFNHKWSKITIFDLRRLGTILDHLDNCPKRELIIWWPDIAYNFCSFFGNLYFRVNFGLSSSTLWNCPLVTLIPNLFHPRKGSKLVLLTSKRPIFDPKRPIYMWNYPVICPKLCRYSDFIAWSYSTTIITITHYKPKLLIWTNKDNKNDSFCKYFSLNPRSL